MLDYFLENAVKKKLYLYHILKASHSISIHEVCDILNMKMIAVNQLIDKLNRDFQKLAKIKRDDQTIAIYICDAGNLLKPLHTIYAHSSILHCLKFMLTNDDCKPFSDFMDAHFLSKSTAYRTREICRKYLQNIGLDIKNNKVIGEEYRIRFLIALLYYKYGFDCCGIDENAIRLARKFILATNQVIDLDYLNKTVNEYGYFECLLILSWKRKVYPVSFEKDNGFEKLKQVFVYDQIILHFKEVIEKELNDTFSEADYDYIFAAYCSTNSCVLADQWTEADIQLIREIIFGHTVYQDLIQRFERKFHLDMNGNMIMHTMFVYFAKKFILELQCIIPDKHFYLDAGRNPVLLKVTHSVEKILQEWSEESRLRYPIDQNHMRCLAIQVETLLRQSVKPVEVIITSDLIVEIGMIELVLTRKFSPKQIQITKFLLNAQKTEFLYGLKNCVIVVNHRLSNYINQLGISQENIVLSVSAEINAYDIQSIQDAVEHYHKAEFLKIDL